MMLILGLYLGMGLMIGLLLLAVQIKWKEPLYGSAAVFILAPLIWPYYIYNMLKFYLYAVQDDEDFI